MEFRSLCLCVSVVVLPLAGSRAEGGQEGQRNLLATAAHLAEGTHARGTAVPAGAGRDEGLALLEEPPVEVVQRLREADAARVRVVQEDLRLVVVPRDGTRLAGSGQPPQ